MVDGLGVWHLHSMFGYPPPMATSKMIEKPLSTPSAQACWPTRLSLMLKYSWPSRYQRICSSEVRRSMIAL